MKRLLPGGPEMFENRTRAGEMLGAALQKRKAHGAVVYGLVRGGLPVAAAAAARIGAPLDIVLVRKLGAPFQRELAIGAIADGAAPATVLHQDRIRMLNVSDDYLKKAEAEAQQELERRRAVFFKDHKAVSPAGKTAILVDDGLATGATMEAAVKAMRSAGAARIIVAIPVAPEETAGKFRRLADEVVCLETPEPFWAVGNHYLAFPQLSDDDVVRILADIEQRKAEAGNAQNPPGTAAS